MIASYISVKAMETRTYTGTTDGTYPTAFNFATLRDGDILAHVMFPLSSHGIYQLNILNSADLYVCRKTLDARWNRASSGDMTCLASAQPAGNYTVEFISNRKVSFTIEVTAETNP